MTVTLEMFVSNDATPKPFILGVPSKQNIYCSASVFFT